MKKRTVYPFFIIGFTLCFLMYIPHTQGQIIINEFMAINEQGLRDEDREREDWIELYNTGNYTIDLEDWHLTDDVNNLTRWAFPNISLESHAYLLVFASGKNRRNPDTPLHTNFKLKGDGEYLGLIQPDGQTRSSEFYPQYPQQAPDISYGQRSHTSETILISSNAPAKAWIPSNDAFERSTGRNPNNHRPWTQVSWDDSNWLTGTSGIGYDYSGLIGLDVSTMRYTNQTVYIRIPFHVENPDNIHDLRLRIAFDDGMICYLNGQEITRINAPIQGNETWNSGAPDNRSDSIAVNPLEIPLSQPNLLQEGKNVLAIQGLNNGISSSDLLIAPELVGTIIGDNKTYAQYFLNPTPGLSNRQGIDAIGPIVTKINHSPEIPNSNESIRITAEINPSLNPVTEATLYYRQMFAPEVAIPLPHAGLQLDNLYSAEIPATDFTPGSMIRWRIVTRDTVGNHTQYPRYADPQNAPKYVGTIVHNPSLTNPLPVLHWFVQSPFAATTTNGTRCALFYDGHFYDNLLINVHGQSSRSFPKNSFDIDFHPGHNFRWAPGEKRADDINLMTTYPDKSHMRNILAYETYRDADSAYHWVIPVRVQQNGSFWGTAHLMENGDEDWLKRMEVNAEGVLYKMYNSFNSTGNATNGAEKKTRKHEDNSDLLALYNGTRLSGQARLNFLYDNVNIPQCINFMALLTITGNTDCCHKNYYLYRDTGHSNEWELWPWDVDLSFGRVWNSTHRYWDQRLHPDTRLYVGTNNGLVSAIRDQSEMREMYLRRVRTLMDEFLMPIGTSSKDLYYEQRIDELTQLIAPDAALDATKWNSDAWGNGSTSPCCPQSLEEAAAEIKNSYLPERRRQLYYGYASGARDIPSAQTNNIHMNISTIEIHPASGDPNDQYILLINPQNEAVDLSGWTLSSESNGSDTLFTFRGGTVIPSQGTLYVVASRPHFRTRTTQPRGNQGHFIVGDLNRILTDQDSVFALTNRQGVTIAAEETSPTPPRPSRR